jgi:hypothetical protein
MPSVLEGPALREIRELFGLFYERCGFGKGPLRSLAYFTAIGDDAAPGARARS